MDLGLFVCQHQKCGRRFPDEKKLNEHIARRHAKASVKLPQLDQQTKDKQNLNMNQVKLNPWDVTKRNSQPNIQQQQQQINQLDEQDINLKQKKEQENNGLKIKQVQKRGLSPGQGQKQTQKLNMAKPKLLSRPNSNQKQVNNIQEKQKQHSINNNNNEEKTQIQIEKLKKSAIEQMDWKKKLDYLVNNDNIQLDSNEIASIKKFSDISQKPTKSQHQNQKQIQITEKMILEETLEEKLEDVINLVLREKNINSFVKGFPFNSLQNIQFLSLSHNNISNISEICQLVSLVDLNLNYNNIEDITPISLLENLEKLYITNNKIKSLTGIDSCQNLKVLCVYRNKIEDFNSSLMTFGDLPYLEDLDIEENPINNEGYDPQQRILSVCQQLKKFNNKQLPKSLRSSQRPTTANTMQNSTTSFMNRTLLLSDKSNNNILNNNSNIMGQSTLSIQNFDKLGVTTTSNDDDMAYYIAQQIQELKDDKEELLENYDELMKDLHESQKNLEKFENNYKIIEEENITLKVENDSLKQQIKLLQQQLKKENKDLPKEEKNKDKQILNLNEQILNLQEEIMDLKLGQVFKDTEIDQKIEEEKELEDEELYQKCLQGLENQKEEQNLYDLEGIDDDEIKALFEKNSKNINEMRMTLSTLNQVKSSKKK